MASQPGLGTQWPWQRLGNFKYLLLAPWVAHSVYLFASTKNGDKNLFNFSILPTLLFRLLLAQIWITISRYQTAKSKRRIVDKSLDFDQVDRERNWDDQILLTALLYYSANLVIPGASNMPWWNTKGVVIAILLHMGPVEFLYYWLHRALHHHYLYSRYHSHHHASIVTEPITAVIHPFAEEMAYFLLFAIPLLTIVFTQTGSIFATVGYLLYIDFMNYLGHCNFELVPMWFFDSFPPLKYLLYTPTFHSIHHTKFRTNFSLFMPFYDYLYSTYDVSSDELYEKSIKGLNEEETLDVVHLTHLTTLQSIFHIRLAIASLASKPYTSKLYLSLATPLTLVSALLTQIFGTTFTMEKNRLKKLQMETWAVPRYNFQYNSSTEGDVINSIIEKAILDAEEKGAKVLSLGLLNQGDELNCYGELYVRKNPNLKIKIVDGTSLAVALVLHSVPESTKNVLLIGKFSKTSYFLSLALCQREFQVEVVQKDLYKLLKLQLPSELQKHLMLSDSYTTSKVWLVGDGVGVQEQSKAPEGAHFIPFSQFPLKTLRKDCTYHSTPALVVPEAFENLHTCENWLPRRVISAWRAAGIIHALEGWKAHECGETVIGIDKAMRMAISHGFLPFDEGCKI